MRNYGYNICTCVLIDPCVAFVACLAPLVEFVLLKLPREEFLQHPITKGEPLFAPGGGRTGVRRDP
jgi:hypothetical protein